MKKEIISRQEIKLSEDYTEINTNIKNLKTYNKKILENGIHLTTNLEGIELMLKTKSGNNLIYAKMLNGDNCLIKKGEVLGHLVDYVEKDSKTR